jgi:hypothetical protein
MNLQFQHLIPTDFANNSKVWIYQCNRQFTLHETLEIETLLEEFTCRWKSHGQDVKGFGNLFFGQFIILMADESATGVSGCSTDSSVRLIKNIEEDYNVNLFDRQTLAFVVKERIQLIPMSELPLAIENYIVTSDTLYFNNTVQSKQQLLNEWIIPVQSSWLHTKFSSLLSHIYTNS